MIAMTTRSSMSVKALAPRLDPLGCIGRYFYTRGDDKMHTAFSGTVASFARDIYRGPRASIFSVTENEPAQKSVLASFRSTSLIQTLR